MHRDFDEEEPRNETYGELILDNVHRIKDQIYGDGNRRFSSSRPGSRTSGRDKEI